MNSFKNQVKLAISYFIVFSMTIWACDNNRKSESKNPNASQLKKETNILPQIEWIATKIQFQNYELGNIRPSVGFTIVVRNETDKTFVLPISKSNNGLFGTTFFLHYMGDTINLKCLIGHEIQIRPYSTDSFDLTMDDLLYSDINDFVFSITRISENYNMIFLKEKLLLGNDSNYVLNQYVSKQNTYRTIISKTSFTIEEY